MMPDRSAIARREGLVAALSGAGAYITLCGAFALRFVDGMELTEVAAACETSLATIKRRLARAGARFEAAARRQPVLEEWLEGGTRWASDR